MSEATITLYCDPGVMQALYEAGVNYAEAAQQPFFKSWTKIPAVRKVEQACLEEIRRFNNFFRNAAFDHEQQRWRPSVKLPLQHAKTLAGVIYYSLMDFRKYWLWARACDCPGTETVFDSVSGELMRIWRFLREEQFKLSRSQPAAEEKPVGMRPTQFRLVSPGEPESPLVEARGRVELQDDTYLEIYLDGYTTLPMVQGPPVVLAFNDQQELTVYVWADLGREDFTHAISLTGAKDNRES